MMFLYIKKDIKDKAYRLKISARSWYISVNMLKIATDTDIRHNIFVEDQNDSHQNIRTIRDYMEYKYVYKK